MRRNEAGFACGRRFLSPRPGQIACSVVVAFALSAYRTMYLYISGLGFTIHKISLLL
jgi:hypothetical protein